MLKKLGAPPKFGNTAELEQQISAAYESTPDLALARISANFMLRLSHAVTALDEYVKNIVI